MFLWALQIVNVSLYSNWCPCFFGGDIINGNVNYTKSYSYQPVYHGPLQESEQAALNFSEGAFKPEVQSSEILSPLVLMIILTILHSQIVATSTNGKLAKSLFSGKRRNRKYLDGRTRGKRRISRHHPRRKPSRTPSATGTPPVVQIAVVAASCSNSATGGCESHPHPCTSTGGTTCKKVLFEDESKSWTSSNSDKDEGIADEYTNENHDSAENDGNGIEPVASTSGEGQDISATIIDANVAATLKGFFDSPAASVDAGQGTSSNELQVSQTLVGELSSAEASPIPEKRSSLRKRNLSKMSEASTTSHSCPDCSSNNNDTSSEEEVDDEPVVEDDDDDDDDDMRSKSEWTAVTTNSEDEDYGDDIHTEDDDEEGSRSDMQLNDHPFAWEFQKVK